MQDEVLCCARIMKFGNDKMFDAYDLDGDGVISPEEWLQGEAAQRTSRKIEASKKQFSDMDADGDDKLSRDEW